jgi:colicin import membrane protein
MSFPLRTLLEIRRRSEEEAERALGEAVAAVAAAEAEQRRLVECAAAARTRADQSRAYDGEGQTVGAALAGETFAARLRDEARQAEAAALTHRKGALKAARASEAVARERHAAARRDRQAADQAQEREQAEQRRVAERRAEDARSDLAAARRRGK